MSKALFVFDHKYPCDINGCYYYSSGFDREFFSRYYSIFDEFVVFGRKEIISEESAKGKTPIEFPCEIITFNSNKNFLTSGANKRLKEAINSSDCVISRMPSIFGSLAIKYAKKANKPYIVEVVACTYDALVNSASWKRRILAKPVEAFYRHVIHDVPFCIYVTEEFLQKKYPCNGEQIACSNVTLSDVRDDVLEARIAKIKATNEHRLVIGTTSTLGVDFKGQQYVIQAIKTLNNLGYQVEYQMVGDGNGDWLMEIAERECVAAQVKLIGSLPHESVFEWLQTLDIYVHPSCQEGLSRAVIEAMSRGCPIVAADTGGIHELIDEEYIVPKKDALSIAHAIDAISSKNVLLSQAIKNHESAKRYTQSVLYAKRTSFYKKFLYKHGIATKGENDK